MKPNSPDKPKDENKPESEMDFSHWQIPDVTQAVPDDVSNLFGRKAVHHEHVEETDAFSPPTLSEIEDIRKQAEQDGFTEGKDEGYQAGIESGRLEGMKQGHSEGFEQGREQGYQDGVEQAKVLINRFESLLSQFEKPMQLLDNEIEHELVQLTMKLSKAVVGHELKTHPEHILSALRLGVDSLPIKEQGINIRLHPDDYQLVQDLYSVNQLEKNRWELEADPSLSPGDCVINSQRSSVDMRLDTRINSVLDELEGHQQHLAQTIERQKQELDSVAKSVVPSSAALPDNNSNNSEQQIQPDSNPQQVSMDKQGNTDAVSGEDSRDEPPSGDSNEQ
ncbi:flagellar assembly protein FliH [Shewanella sediminis HAW-EB3]|uniref:Flagellar assembly protein FliH n=1 Tax=Shewanella sediminis (strain HAW-EB3) TaxID=425104 RepID=A8FXU5_SHESH|nr:flagellar assembly protein FliH [Shewanella sediminis]ABV37668.1 flagellar assembly protein FliH [Shewanella sediminis HAW-EB3]